jgi:hypothetical protein
MLIAQSKIIMIIKLRFLSKFISFTKIFCILFLIWSMIMIILQTNHTTQAQEEPIAADSSNIWNGTYELLFNQQAKFTSANGYSTDTEKGADNGKFSFTILKDNSIKGSGNGIVQYNADGNGKTYPPHLGEVDSIVHVVGNSKITFSVRGNYDPSTGSVHLKFLDFSRPSTTVTGCSYSSSSSFCFGPQTSNGISLLSFLSEWLSQNPVMDLKDQAKVENEVDLLAFFSKSQECPGCVSTLNYKITIYGHCFADVYTSAFLPPWTPNGRVPNPFPMNVLVGPSGTLLPPQSQRYDYHEFSTDNRNKPMKGASARQWSYVVVDLCNDNPFVDKRHGVGISHGFRYVWQNGRVVEVEDTKTASDKGMSESVSKSGNSVVLHIKGATAIPFVQLSPTIDYDYTIVLWKDGDNVVYRISGDHDGFPAYEIFIGTENVYFFTPKVAEGQNPLSPFNKGQSILSLFPPSEFSVSKNGEIPQNQAYDAAFDNKIVSTIH